VNFPKNPQNEKCSLNQPLLWISWWTKRPFRKTIIHLSGLYLFTPNKNSNASSSSFVTHTTSTAYNIVTIQSIYAPYTIFTTPSCGNFVTTNHNLVNLERDLFCNLQNNTIEISQTCMPLVLYKIWTTKHKFHHPTMSMEVLCSMVFLPNLSSQAKKSYPHQTLALPCNITMVIFASPFYNPHQTILLRSLGRTWHPQGVILSLPWIFEGLTIVWISLFASFQHWLFVAPRNFWGQNEVPSLVCKGDVLAFPLGHDGTLPHPKKFHMH